MTAVSIREERATVLGRSVFRFAWRPTITATANGRIEVIGNHVDYNGGPVIAAAIDRGITILAGPTSTASVRVAFPDMAAGPPAELIVDELRDWRANRPAEPSDYARGVISAAIDAGHAVRPSLDVLVHGDIPVGGGVSSSAALCVGLALALLNEPVDRPTLVRLAQEAEHRAGTPCGTMDQSASVFGGLILFGGSPDNVANLPAELGSLRFVVLGSGVQRSLAVSKYADRVDECQRALDRLKATLGERINVLADVSPDELSLADDDGVFDDEPTLLLRARHIVSEVARVREGLGAIERHDWREFGRLMNASGHSSAFDYDISHPVVEEVVALATRSDGVLGARMMGGGEGGNALALVEAASIPSLRERLSEAFYRPRGLDVETLMFECRLGEAASVVLR